MEALREGGTPVDEKGFRLPSPGTDKKKRATRPADGPQAFCQAGLLFIEELNQVFERLVERRGVCISHSDIAGAPGHVRAF